MYVNDVCCEFAIYGLYYIEISYFYAYFLNNFYRKWYWILSKAFSVSIEMIIWFLFFSLLIFYTTFFLLDICL